MTCHFGCEPNLFCWSISLRKKTFFSLFVLSFLKRFFCCFVIEQATQCPLLLYLHTSIQGLGICFCITLFHTTSHNLIPENIAVISIFSYNYSNLPIATAVSAIRFEKPHSLSYQDRILAIPLGNTFVC